MWWVFIAIIFPGHWPCTSLTPSSHPTHTVQNSPCPSHSSPHHVESQCPQVDFWLAQAEGSALPRTIQTPLPFNHLLC